jgi:hypothetical protein
MVPPRNSTTRRDDPNLHRTGRRESVFTLFAEKP